MRHAAVQGVAGKVDESLERRDELACATGGGFSMPQAAPTSMGYHSCTGIEEGIKHQHSTKQESRVTACCVCIRRVIRPDRDQPKPPPLRRPHSEGS